MNISEKIGRAKNEVFEDALKKKKISKALSFMKKDILELSEAGLNLSEQCEVLSKALDLKINLSTYKSFYYRNIEKKYNDKKEPKSTPKKEVKNEVKQEPKKEIKSGAYVKPKIKEYNHNPTANADELFGIK